MGFLTHFSLLEDPRIDNNTKVYSVELLVFIAISGVVSGFDTWVEIAFFAEQKRSWINRFVPVPDRMPSHDTLGNFFRRLDSKQFASCFSQWASDLTGHNHDDLLVIDGKTLRGSADRANSKKAIHLINVWAGHSRIVLGQHPVDSKENEIKAIPELLNMLELKNTMVAIDAIGCQKEIAAQIVSKNGDYLLAVKGNQPELLEEIQTTFPLAKSSQKHIQKDRGHGRIETRSCTVMACEDEKMKQTWKGLTCFIRMEHRRYVLAEKKESVETLYFISSKMMSPEQAAMNIRLRWTIENNLHWMLDVTFNEDKSRVRKDNADANLAVIRKIALNMIRLEITPKQSLNLKRRHAGLSDKFREAVLKV